MNSFFSENCDLHQFPPKYQVEAARSSSTLNPRSAGTSGSTVTGGSSGTTVKPGSGSYTTVRSGSAVAGSAIATLLSSLVAGLLIQRQTRIC